MYLVYEHWRPDTDTCFYVGKGKLRRAKDFSARNDRHGKIIAKLIRLKLKPEMKIVATFYTDREAIEFEISRIKFRREQGFNLANYTNGGDGICGYKHSKKSKAKIALKAIGRIMSKETIDKMIVSRNGSKRSEKTRAKMSESAKSAQKVRFVKEKKTISGRLALNSKMTIIARKGIGTPEYSERKRQAALARWVNCRCTSRVVVEGFS